MSKEKNAASLPYIKFVYNDFDANTRVLDHITRSAYMILTCAAQNNAQDRGSVHVTLCYVAEIMRLDTPSAWRALCRMASCGDRRGGSLIELHVRRDGDFRIVPQEDAVKRADTPEDLFTDLRIVIPWVRDGENEIINKRINDCDRKTKQQKLNSTEFHGIPRNSTEANGIPRNSTEANGIPRNSKEFRLREEKRREEKKRENPPLPPKGVFDTWFEETFWKAYPNKESKKKARESAKKAFAKDDADNIMDGLERAKRSDQWNRDGGRFIPYAATWLNQERWRDEGSEQAAPEETTKTSALNIGMPPEV